MEAGPASGSSVEIAKGLPDGSRTVLEGRIVKELDRFHYRFRDITGEVEIEIDEEIWRGRSVNPQTRIRINGSVDQSRLETLIDVTHVEILSGPDREAPFPD